MTYNDLMAWVEDNGASCSLGCDDVVEVTTTIGECSVTSQVYRSWAQVEHRGLTVRVGRKDTALEALTEAVRIVKFAMEMWR